MCFVECLATSKLASTYQMAVAPLVPTKLWQSKRSPNIARHPLGWGWGQDRPWLKNDDLMVEVGVGWRAGGPTSGAPSAAWSGWPIKSLTTRHFRNLKVIPAEGIKSPSTSEGKGKAKIGFLAFSIPGRGGRKRYCGRES